MLPFDSEWEVTWSEIFPINLLIKYLEGRIVPRSQLLTKSAWLPHRIVAEAPPTVHDSSEVA